MKILNLYAGIGGNRKLWGDEHEVTAVEYDEKIAPIYGDHFPKDTLVVGDAHEYLRQHHKEFDFIWASPPCTAFSVASIGHHWGGGRGAYIPKTESAEMSQRLVAHTRRLIENLNPRLGFIIENPRGVLRKLPILDGLERKTITYCQYGDDRMKPTDLWTNLDWQPREACKNGQPCHVAAPRGSRTGTQGRKGARDRSMVPYELGLEIRRTIVLKEKIREVIA